MKKFVLYIVYGDKQEYYVEAYFSILTIKNWISHSNNVEIVVLTEKPKKFIDCDVKIIQMSNKQKNEWSLNGQYHFRIKNRGLAFVMDELKLTDKDKILFFDTDTYFHNSPLPLFELIRVNQALFYLNEGLIYKRKRFKVYTDFLEGNPIEVDGNTYNISKKSALWGSLMIGLMANMRQSLDWADKLMLKLYEIVPVHTIEEFSLSESLSRDFNLVEGKKFVSLYSTSRKKEYALSVISNFLNLNESENYDEKVRLAQKVKIKRPLFVILKQRMQRLVKINATE